MILEEYILKKTELVTKFAQKSKLWNEDIMIAKFNIVSACLSNYLPEISPSEHLRIFKNIFLHQQLSKFEQSFFELPDYIGYENLTTQIWSLLNKGASIICTFHTGSYRLINLFLAKNKIPFSLVVSKEMIAVEGDSLKEMYEMLNKLDNSHEGLKLIDAESPSSGLQMIKDLKQGRNLVIYVDGNVGAGNETINNNNSCEINFLHHKIFVRQGVGVLAHALQVPLVTVASYRKSINEIKLKFFDPIFSDVNLDRAQFTKKNMQEIYDLVAPIIIEYPDQWEAWLYLHKVTAPNGNDIIIALENTNLPDTNDKLRFNSSCFGIFKIVSDCFLFKKSNYKSYKISDAVYNLLVSSAFKPIPSSEVVLNEFAELYVNKVLVPA